MANLPGVHRGTELVLSALFVVSGFAAILYQITWQRMLFALIGINIEVVTLIVTLFIGGLGIGSLLGGVASRLAAGRLLAAFAALELGIGAFGAASPSLFGGVGRLAVHLDPPMVAFGVAALVLPPTLAMGATLPILVTHFVARRAHVGVAVGTLYCVNTLGSALAAFAAGLWLVRWLGLSGVLTIAVLCNVTIAAFAFAVHRRKA
jgi:predicted membrane-bound spermidine synthase